MANSKEGDPFHEAMRVAQHDSIESHFEYAEPDNKSHDKRCRSMASKTVTKCDDDCKVKSIILLNVSYYLLLFFKHFLV